MLTILAHALEAYRCRRDFAKHDQDYLTITKKYHGHPDRLGEFELAPVRIDGRTYCFHALHKDGRMILSADGKPYAYEPIRGVFKLY